MIPLNNNQIPLIIHQIWMNPKENDDDHPMPEKYQQYGNEWKKMVSSQNYILWNHNSMDAFILNSNDREFYGVYRRLKSWINRCDAFRYFVLYHIGGIYLDMDIKPNHELIDYIQSKNKKGHKEIIVQNIKFPDAYTNWFIASAPKNDLMKQLYTNVKIDTDSAFQCAGPFYLTKIVRSFKKSNSFPVGTVYKTDLPIQHLAAGSWIKGQVIVYTKKYVWIIFVILLFVIFLTFLLLLIYFQKNTK